MDTNWHELGLIGTTRRAPGGEPLNHAAAPLCGKQAAPANVSTCRVNLPPSAIRVPFAVRFNQFAVEISQNCPIITSSP